MSYDDDRLDAALRALPVEDHGPRFWTELEQDLDAAAADVRAQRALRAGGASASSAGGDVLGATPDGQAERPAAPAAGPSLGPGAGGAGAGAGASASEAGVSSLSEQRARRRRANLARVAAVAAAAIVVVAVAVVWNGARGDDRQELNVVVTPPAPDAPRPLTLTAAYEVTGENGGGFRLTVADDGSFAWVGTSTDDVSVDMYYDASTGRAVETGIVSAGEVDSFVTAGVPAGGPDRGIAVPPPLGSLAAAVTSLGRAQSGEIEVATFLDRPVWRYDGPIVADALGGDGTPDHAVVDVDQQTGVALSISWRAGDVPLSEVVATSVAVTEGIDRSSFLGLGTSVHSVADFDRGFAPSTIEAAGEQVGYPVLVPGAVPEGFRLASVTVDTEVPSTTGAEGSNPPVTDIVSMHWRNGFLSFTVTLRPGGEGVTDPFGAEGMRYRPEYLGVELAGGSSFAGEIVLEPPARPHLWGTTGGLVVTIDGDLTADDLYQAALSLAPAASSPADSSSSAPSPAGDDVTAGDAPAVFVGVESGRVARYDATTGERQAFLTEAEPGGGDSEPVLVDGTVWFVRGAGTCSSGIWSVSLDGGDPVEVVPAGAGAATGVAVSADARMLAWVYQPCDDEATELRTRDLRSDQDRSFSFAFQLESPDQIGKPSWAPDGRRLALRYVSTGSTSSDFGNGLTGVDVYDGPSTLLVLDTVVASDVDDGTHFPTRACSRILPAYLADGSLVVLTCLVEDELDRAAAARLDPATGELLGTLFELVGPLQGAGAEAVIAFELSPDGRHALYEVIDGEGLSNVYRWDGGTPVRVDTSAAQPSW